MTSGAWAKDINIGAMVPLTGGGAFYGRLMRDIGQGVVNDINKAGIKGFDKMNIRFYDDGNDATIAASQIERAVSQGANFIWGGFVSTVERMMTRKAEELKIPTSLTNETSYEGVLCKTKYSIVPVAGSMEGGKIIAKYFKEQNVKTYAFIGADYVWCRTSDQSLAFYLRGTGIKKIYENWHDFSKVDYSSDIMKLKELKPDAVIRPFSGAGNYIIIKQMKDAGYWPRIFIADPTISGYQVTLDELGPDYIGDVMAWCTQDPRKPRWIEFAKTHKEKYGYWPTWLSHGMHDTLWLIKKAAETAGTLDPETVAKAMRNSSYDGVASSPCGPFQESGLPRKTAVNIIKFVKGPPPWSNQLPYHREVVCSLEVSPMCKEEIDKALGIISK